MLQSPVHQTLELGKQLVATVPVSSSNPDASFSVGWTSSLGAGGGWEACSGSGPLLLSTPRRAGRRVCVAQQGPVTGSDSGMTSGHI